jgi:ornithine--oxo-acid transaminase
MDAEELIALDDRYSAHNYDPLDVIISRGEGVWVYDTNDNKYLDCLSAYSALNHGHCHPRIIRALVSQAQRLTLTSRAFRNDQLPLLYKDLHDLTGYDMFLPMNTGVEAVETALKAARRWGYIVKGVPEDQAEIIACAGNFHGRTITVISFSSEPAYRQGFGPFTPGFTVIPYGDAEALRTAIHEHTVAFLVEPIQGEGGVIIPPAGYLREAKQLCAESNVLFMADEIQTGLGRTGRLFACDHEDVRPDIMIIGKALSGGVFPVSMVLSSREVLGVFQPGDHGSTFGGNPLGCAVAREALAVLVEERLIENAARMGDILQSNLMEIPSPHIRQVRGRGLLIGVELWPEAGGARRFCQALKEEGLLCKETHVNTIRFAPPLIITQEEIEWASQRIYKVFMEH